MEDAPMANKHVQFALLRDVQYITLGTRTPTLHLALTLTLTRTRTVS